MSESTWAQYNAKQGERDIRPLCLELLTLAGPGAGRQAVDLGCGLGRETDALLRAGWRVHAVDFEENTEANLQATTRPEDREHLTIEMTGFADLARLPPADLVHAAYSIPYIPQAAFAHLIRVIHEAVRPGGWFAANLLGVNDSYRQAHEQEYTFLTEDEARDLFPDWTSVRIDVEEFDGNSFSGPKHWHLLHVFAQR